MCLCSQHVETVVSDPELTGQVPVREAYLYTSIGSTLIDLVGFTLKLDPSVSYVYPTCILVYHCIR